MQNYIKKLVICTDNFVQHYATNIKGLAPTL